ESSLPEQVIVVPAGVLDLVELQSQGYAYIKP
ncbi:sulfur reduction protein DsrE, partial [Klebsiella pneumoniae]|nr:sulfur reduction protein DsrE [Klebsiella pneumoniae]